MLESLLEIEVAYNLLKSEEGSNMDPIDAHYSKLHCKLEVVLLPVFPVIFYKLPMFSFATSFH